MNSRGRTIFIADAHRGDRKRFVVRADEKLTAFLELELAISGMFPMLAVSDLLQEKLEDGERRSWISDPAVRFALKA